MYTPLSSTLRFVVPKIEKLALDRRSGAYPTKARTGDRTRRGNNKFYFDDTRSVLFETGTTISFPTTFQVDETHLDSDLASDLTASGDVKPHAVDQWIAHREQSEAPGPFVESDQHEQDETNVVNSSFMTGVAHHIAPDRFKSKLSNKTIIRISVPLTASTTLTPGTSSLYYLNPDDGKFDLIANERYYFSASRDDSFTNFYFLGESVPRYLDAVPFTAYGYAHSPYNQTQGFSGKSSNDLKEKFIQQLNNYVPDGNTLFNYKYEAPFFDHKLTSYTASFINTNHAANSHQGIDLSNFISHPFLLEKAVLEFPVEAGPGWMNDAFQFVPFASDAQTGAGDGNYGADCGGPMVTAFLTRQDRTSPFHRDLIASATFTNARDAFTASYTVYSRSVSVDDPSAIDVFTVRVGLSGNVNPGFVLQGLGAESAYSGTNNYYTGSTKLILEPAVTHHVARYEVSGVINSFAFGGFVGAGSGNNRARTTNGIVTSFGFNSRRPGILENGRSVLGNSFALLSQNEIDGVLNPVKWYEQDYESIKAFDGNNIGRYKLYTDVVSKTTKSPYLLYPSDKLIVGLNKYRAAASAIDFGKYDDDYLRHITGTLALHDIKVPTGMLTLTLYGDLIKEDREFHDTLNQRLETVEIWETIGEEPVLDQFDVAYSNELSGSYLDINNITQQFPSIKELVGYPVGLTGSVFSFFNARNPGHFQENNINLTWAALLYDTHVPLEIAGVTNKYDWLHIKKAWELKKSNKNIHIVSDERMWDTRIPDPLQACLRRNKDFIVQGSTYYGGWSQHVIYPGEQSYLFPHMNPLSGGNGGNGIKDWYMTYPFEPTNDGIKAIFFESLNKETWPWALNGTSSLKYNRTLDYDTLVLELGTVREKINPASNGNLAYEGSKFEFSKIFYGIGDGVDPKTNQYVKSRYVFHTGIRAYGADIRGWRYGLANAFPMYSTTVFRRDRFGQPRDMLEQRIDTKFFDSDTGARLGPIQVSFFDREGNLTDPELTLSSNLSYEVTSSTPYIDGVARNRGEIDYSSLNISSVVL